MHPSFVFHRIATALVGAVAAAQLVLAQAAPGHLGRLVPVWFVTTGCYLITGAVVRRRRRRWTVRQGDQPAFLAFGSLRMLWTLWFSISAARLSDLIADRGIGGPFSWLAVLTLAGLGYWYLLALLDRPRLELTPDGVRLVRGRGTEQSWEWLAQQRGELAPRLAATALSREWSVHSGLVVATVRWYLDHPEQRAAIGTEAELERVLAKFVDFGPGR